MGMYEALKELMNDLIDWLFHPIESIKIRREFNKAVKERIINVEYDIEKVFWDKCKAIMALSYCILLFFACFYLPDYKYFDIEGMPNDGKIDLATLAIGGLVIFYYYGRSVGWHEGHEKGLYDQKRSE